MQSTQPVTLLYDVSDSMNVFFKVWRPILNGHVPIPECLDLLLNARLSMIADTFERCHNVHVLNVHRWSRYSGRQPNFSPDLHQAFEESLYRDVYFPPGTHPEVNIHLNGNTLVVYASR